MLNILIIGLGGVGSIAAFVLEKSKQAKVTGVLRSNYAVVEADGFNIDSVDHGKVEGWRPSIIIPSITLASTFTIYDYILITTKCHPSQLPPLLDSLEKLIIPTRTSILLLQNGLDIEPPFAKAFPSIPILSGISMIGSRLTSPNSVFHEDPDSCKIGAFLHDTASLPPHIQCDAVRTFVDVYNAGLADAISRDTGAGCTFVSDVVAARWRKLLWNGTFNTLCTLLRISVGELLRSPGRASLLEPAMREMASIARAAGYRDAVTEATIEDMLGGTPVNSKFRPSMLVDLEKGRAFDLEVILGAPLKIARDFGVGTPVLDNVYSLLSVVLWNVTRIE